MAMVKRFTILIVSLFLGIAVCSALLAEIMIARSPGGTWTRQGSYPQLLLFAFLLSTVLLLPTFAIFSVPVIVTLQKSPRTFTPLWLAIVPWGLVLMVAVTARGNFGRTHFLWWEALTVFVGFFVASHTSHALLSRQR